VGAQHENELDKAMEISDDIDAVWQNYGSCRGVEQTIICNKPIMRIAAKTREINHV
jgi:hypothetical protein